ncbi:hypothetical protein P167DRAFT_570018 [Morchella conica CCBAS932]|uniref:Uncharacterized protein n=1 Tax=Morchella conica CCBAS932 TaxID=1392247 RepID=A0A3N4L5U6_9PEZI|nr:hypothetical protein P167DRAFT_570018 [Morchella conica CCBAS932]
MQGANNQPSVSNSSVFAGARSIASSLSSQLKASISDPPPQNTPFNRDPESLNKKSESSMSNNNMAGRDSSQTAPTPNQLQAPFTPRRMGFPGPLSLKMPSRGPLSPVLDPALGYSVARRPRLDFARACTSLHHSTLAEQPSPDSSPSTSTSFPIPRNNKGSDSPIANHHHYHHSSSHASSLGSASMMDYAPSGDDSDSSSDEDLDVDLDLELGTPFAPAIQSTESAASISLMNHQKARLGGRAGRNSRHSSLSSASASNSSLASPSPTTPPVQNSSFGVGYFGRSKEGAARRKDSLTTALRNSLAVGGRGNDDEKRPDPIRRPVSRRGSLLPKTKTFQRIKAALQEEASPVDMEVKREAEITRQIREEDEESVPATAIPTQPSMDQELSDIREEDESMGSSGENVGLVGNKGIGISFSRQAQKHGGFWFGDQMDGLGGSPPTFPGLRMTSDGDIMMNSESTVSSPVASVPADMRRPKRRRTQDERFEPEFFKRRAVSPGLSHSPILAASPPLSGANGGGKRLNFQGMSDTGDGIMKMSLQ